jgi:hypothetical protein
VLQEGMTLSHSLLLAVVCSTLALGRSDAADTPVRDPDRETLLALPWKEFDQTQNSGWRVYVNPSRKEYLKGARLIEDYLERHSGLTARQRAIGHYHAAHQYIYRAVRGGEGDVREALPHLDRAIVPQKEPAPSEDWNDMVIATKAFLLGDRDTLQRARDRIAALPGASVKWPGYADDLLKNFGQPYGSWYPGAPASK